ncbi:protein trichome birefringence-like 34 [Rhododendron vialii]|uniref:protein trichome birefringence-like 34 n=1 Tax=Rhododendron vialii TaxID=182163 RepID=UPI00265E577B|nr:protein trichome birefringence-like 34 [Rhododendron vialii]
MATKSQILHARGRRIRSSNIISYVIAILIGGLILGAVYMTKESRNWLALGKGKTLSSCNLFSGKWVYDDESYPLYKENHCSFMSIFNGVSCERTGRMDSKYQHWRWQPHDCDLPRFDAMAMLDRLRGKRLVFVGDAVTRNQWASMVCLLDSSIPPALKSVITNGSTTTLKINEYNATIQHYWAPYLVQSNSDHPVLHNFSSEQIVGVQAIERHARLWTDADILVFNSHMWGRRPKFKVLWGSFESPDKIYEEVEMLRALEIALKTWSDWLEFHINRTKTKIYFVSRSPTHERGEEWGKAKGENCYGETEPILKEGYPARESNPRVDQMLETTITKLKTRGLKIQTIDITQLSEYRKDAHTSIYQRMWNRLTKEQLANPKTYADCANWCVPGVPDVWNELLYTYIFHF